MTQIHLHPVTDKELILSLDRRIFPEDDPVIFEGTKWWVAFKGRIPVGFAGIKPLTGTNKGTGLLTRAGVVYGTRGQGLQRRFINARLRWARQNGITDVITYTSHDNPWSMNNLIRAGFLTYNPLEHWAGSKFVYWKRSLS